MAKQTVENIPFTQVANVVLNDKTLSMKAKGMYAYLFSKPNDWEFSSERIQRDFPDGIDAVLSALKELVKVGYLQRMKRPDGKCDYHLVHTLNGKIPVRENPCQGKNLKGKTRPLNNKEDITNKEISTNKEFSWEESLKKMEEKTGSDMDIIATYLLEKKIVPTTSKQLSGYISRYRKTAMKIAPFVGAKMENFFAAMEICKEESFRLGYEWELETVYKKITKMKL